MRGLKTSYDKVQLWREKAKNHRIEKERLKKRLKEVKQGRQSWRSKHHKCQQELVLLRKRLAALEKKLADKPSGHSYDSFIIKLALWLRYQGNCSLRSSRKILSMFILLLELNSSIPSHVSISNWEKKLGYYRLYESSKATGDWMIFIDESIVVGQQRMLLILGLCLNAYEFGRALCFEDVEVLGFGIQKSWTGEEIEREIAQLKSSGLSILYCTSDNGNNIRKSLRINDLIHIEDCTHAFGKLLEKQYKNQEEFMAFSKQCVKFKRCKMLGTNAFLIPPTQRSKGRFLNLEPLATWAYQWLKRLEKEGQKKKQPAWCKEMVWLKKYQLMIERIYEDCLVMHQLFKILKPEGLGEQSAEKCRDILKKNKATTFFKEGVQQYLTKNLAKIDQLNQVICTSDIIESFFGKLKNRLSENKAIGLTDSCLGIANFSKQPDKNEVKKAMESVKIIDIFNWRKKYLELNLIQKKKRAFKNAG